MLFLPRQQEMKHKGVGRNTWHPSGPIPAATTVLPIAYQARGDVFPCCNFQPEKKKRSGLQQGYMTAKKHPDDPESEIKHFCNVGTEKKLTILDKKTFGKIDKQGKLGRLCVTTTKGSPCRQFASWTQSCVLLVCVDGGFSSQAERGCGC